jgi:hypothetical protein
MYAHYLAEQFKKQSEDIMIVRPMNQPTKVFNNPVAWCHLLD